MAKNAGNKSILIKISSLMHECNFLFNFTQLMAQITLYFSAHNKYRVYCLELSWTRIESHSDTHTTWCIYTCLSSICNLTSPYWSRIESDMHVHHCHTGTISLKNYLCACWVLEKHHIASLCTLSKKLSEIPRFD